jgi:DNA invertase Pin-like site-specific DNA recombinase
MIVSKLEGAAFDRILTDKALGKNTHRAQLQELLRFVRGDDTVVLHSMDRLARSPDELKNSTNLH